MAERHRKMLAGLKKYTVEAHETSKELLFQATKVGIYLPPAAEGS